MSEKEIYNTIVKEEPYCMLCGKTNWLEIHHIYYRSQGGITTKKNLIRLCKECHQKVHLNKKKWQPFLLNMQYNKYGYFTKEECIKCKKYG